jgi:hypothetical protein
VSPAPSAIASTAGYSPMPIVLAVLTTRFMPVMEAARTVIRLRDCSTPQRIVCGPAFAPEKLRKHFRPKRADW